MLCLHTIPLNTCTYIFVMYGKLKMEIRYSEMHHYRDSRRFRSGQIKRFCAFFFQDTCTRMLKRRPGCIIAAKRSSKPLDLTATESARVSTSMHLSVHSTRSFYKDDANFNLCTRGNPPKSLLNRSTYIHAYIHTHVCMCVRV
jgi:hypothetical protein